MNPAPPVTNIGDVFSMRVTTGIQWVLQARERESIGFCAMKLYSLPGSLLRSESICAIRDRSQRPKGCCSLVDISVTILPNRRFKGARQVCCHCFRVVGK